jgi:hypothetical protein
MFGLQVVALDIGIGKWVQNIGVAVVEAVLLSVPFLGR